jgi:predicted RNA binding protein YcfA (HicA-like mRNA interferase family)
MIPVHSGESLGPGLLAKILRDVERTRDELEELLS